MEENTSRLHESHHRKRHARHESALIHRVKSLLHKKNITYILIVIIAGIIAGYILTNLFNSPPSQKESYTYTEQP